MDNNPFSQREKDVVARLLQGKSNKQIALELGISIRTVEFHLGNIYTKLGVASRTEAVLKITERHLGETTGAGEDRIQVHSTVEANPEAPENKLKSSSRRFPVKNLVYLIGGGLLVTLLVVIFVLTNSPSDNPGPVPTQTGVSHVTQAPVIKDQATETPKVDDSATEEPKIRDIVETFGKRLQAVSLLAPDAAQEIQKQYSGFVSPALLDMWMKDASKAPGRLVSSPWPDRIEITTLVKDDADRYEITGNVIEVTSLELANGGAANKIPVHLVVQQDQGQWLITEYTQVH